MNKVIVGSSEDELKHYGKLGMKWGKTLRGHAAKSLGKQTTKVVRRFDKGLAAKGNAAEISRRVRKEKYKLSRKTARAKKYLDKASAADAKGVINRFNKNPEKRALVKDYMETMQVHTKTLESYRMDLMDVRL